MAAGDYITANDINWLVARYNNLCDLANSSQNTKISNVGWGGG